MATVTQNETAQEPYSCPYWSPFICSCLLVKDDLFIPLKDHVVIYCTSSRFYMCFYYSQRAIIKNQTQGDQESSTNHRRSNRICHCKRFSYSEILNNHLIDKGNFSSWALDISEHGIRFASEKLLDPDTAIHFSVENEEAFTTIEGVGKVVWCSPLTNSSFFQVGLAVTWLHH